MKKTIRQNGITFNKCKNETFYPDCFICRVDCSVAINKSCKNGFFYRFKIKFQKNYFRSLIHTNKGDNKAFDISVKRIQQLRSDFDNIIKDFNDINLHI